MAVTMKSDSTQNVFTFKNIQNAIVNTIRKIIIDDVPTMAIEDVEVVENEGPLFDETVAHRLGLIPLTTDLKSYNFREDCKCGAIGCALCEVKLVLKAEGEGYILSSKLKSNDPRVVPADMNLPISKLFGEKKKMQINMKAKLGRGKEHSKWSPAHAYLRENKKNIELIIEPYGQLSGRDVYNKAVEILIDRISELEKAIK